jgi:hypothetical protein
MGLLDMLKDVADIAGMAKEFNKTSKQLDKDLDELDELLDDDNND